ncbi:MAG: bifunctional glycosyltransferase/CDP-glycerol:glycerophosphate glycerophosphotransferase [Nocardioidaceae bacterium]
MDVSLQRLKRTRVAQAFKRRVLRRRPDPPLLSVVVPFFDSAPCLAVTIESVLGQTCQDVQLVLVDDGSQDGSIDIARRYAASHTNIIVCQQKRKGVGAARNHGARVASGRYLAFCDADDIVPAGGYERLVSALETSGSDLCVGSVSLQNQGRHQEPAWARRSNGARRLGARLDEVPQIMANLLVGPRAFRRSFWERHRLAFPSQGEQSDVVTIVEAMLLTDAIDIIPSVVYRWCWREDGRTLLQRSFVDSERMADRVARISDAGELVVRCACQDVQAAFFADILHTTVPDLVRAAVARDDVYWAALSNQLRRLVGLMSERTLALVPVEDRWMAWLCARNHRDVTEQFLEYSFDNQFGYPYRTSDDRALITLPFVDALPDATEELTRVADTDMRYRTRLTAMRWVAPLRLRVEGGAFIEYVDDTFADSRVTLVLRERSSGTEIRQPTSISPALNVNQWAARAHEDHTAGGFSTEIDLTSIPLEPGGRLVLDVEVELTIGPYTRRSPFQTRQTSGSAGLLEQSLTSDRVVVPGWRTFTGLELILRQPRPADLVPATVNPRAILVDDVVAGDGAVVVTGQGSVAFELALVGPRSRTSWVRSSRHGDAFEANVDVLLDEWGLGATELPEDIYALHARAEGGELLPVTAARGLWRTLPRTIEVGQLHVTASVSADSESLLLRVSSREWRASRTQYLRRQLRDELYPTARTKPLLDVALFETFAGRAVGDNPAALCRELARREDHIELVYSVLDRSVAAPEGARTVVRWSPEWFELVGRARYLIVNSSLPYFFRKREGQLYYQTWHGSPLKQIAHDRPHLDFSNWHHRRQLLIARDGWDFLLSQSEFCTGALRSAFRYDGEVMEFGYPRNDLLVSAEADEVRNSTRDHLGLSADQLVVLYAPTWRDNLRLGRVFNKVLYLDPEAIVDRIPGSVVLVRGHYNSVRAAEKVDPDRRVIDVTRYPDIADLYLAADALVTDYSSVFFDFVLTDKPMAFLAPDLTEYRDDNRGFYLDYHSTVPGPVCVNTDEVVDVLSSPDEYAARRREFRATYTPNDDGKASARVIDAILEWGSRRQ